MAFQLSPGINVSEIDLSTVVPAVATTEGATVGAFRWGPVNERILVSSEVELVSRFGKPHTAMANNAVSWTNHESFFSAANFLSYSDALYVTRVVDSTAVTATGTSFAAKYPGDLGNNIDVAFAGSAGWDSTNGVGVISLTPGSAAGTITLVTTSSANSVIDELAGAAAVGDAIIAGGQAMKITSIGSVQLASTNPNFDDDGDPQTPAVTQYTYTIALGFGERFIGATAYQGAYTKEWGFKSLFDRAPQAGHVHVVVTARTAAINGVAGSILETYSDVSTVPGARKFDGSTNYLTTVLENNSNWIALASGVTPDELANTYAYNSMAGGADGASENSEEIQGEMLLGWDLYKNKDEVDVSLLILGGATSIVKNYVIDNIAEYRKDCLAFISAGIDDTTAQQVVTTAAAVSGSSYAVMDSGYKYMYDKYNDVYRWVPLNADIAGTCARTDNDRDPWFSPAGYSRGQIKNVIKLRFNPDRTSRDLLYKNNVNPVIIEPGQGALLFGDKTMQRIASAFDRINVRRLFIVLEKAVSAAAKATLFEFNDEFTRAQFVNLVEPFLRDVQGRRGIYDYRVVCDTTNNTAEVIDRNEFVGDIYIKPARSINFIQLNFVAVRSGVEFNEIVGQF